MATGSAWRTSERDGSATRGQLIGWESIVLYNPETGGAFVAIVNGTGSLVAAKAVAAQALPDLLQLLG